jgi:hypothetical protein
MKFDEYYRITKNLESSGFFKEAETLFKEALDKKIGNLDDQDLCNKEVLANLLSFTFREAFKFSYSNSLLQGQKLEGDVIPKEDLEKPTLRVIPTQEK